MALTEEQLLLQADILASKTDSATNPNMAYKANTTLNKGLNPDLFSGNNTKIVNAINKLAADAAVVINQSSDVSNKINEILMDTSTTFGENVWNETKELMEKDSMIEGIRHILQGQQADKILGLTSDDIGKVLSVDVDMLGNLIVKSVDMPSGGSGGGGGFTGDISDLHASNIPYANPGRPEISNVAEALDAALEGGMGGGVGDILWQQILNPPEIPNELSLTSQALILKSSEGDLSSVDIMNDADIDEILLNLD